MDLAGLRIADTRDKVAELIAHGLCGDASGGSLEVHVAGAASADRVGVATGYEGGRHVDVDRRGGGGRDEKRGRICAGQSSRESVTPGARVISIILRLFTDWLAGVKTKHLFALIFLCFIQVPYGQLALIFFHSFPSLVISSTSGAKCVVAH